MRRRLLLPLKRRLADSGGFTLSELMVCCVLMLIVGGLVTQTLIFGFRQSGDRSRDSAAVSLCGALEAKTRTILEMAKECTCSGDADNPTVSNFKTDAYKDQLGDDAYQFSQDDDGRVTLQLSTDTASCYLLVPEGSYSNGELNARVNVSAYVADDNVVSRFEAEITITDTAGDELAKKIFHILPVMKVTPITAPDP